MDKVPVEIPFPFVVCMAVGVLTISFYVFSFLKCLVEYQAGGIPVYEFGMRQDAWAVITGATAGLGYEFALQFAKAGYNVVLISRDPRKLKETVQNIARKVPTVDMESIAFDFDKASPKDWERLTEQLQKIDARILVNNVGKSHEHPEYFANMSATECDSIIRINVESLVKMTRIVVPNMKQKKNGLILNIGSFASLTSTPFLSVYAGTKSFVHSFSQALGAELEEDKITVSYVNSYLVVSALSKIRKSSWLVPTPATYVRSVITHLGQPVGAARSQPYVSNPYLPHALLQLVIDYVGLWSLYFWVNKYTHKAIRKRALQKKGKAL